MNVPAMSAAGASPFVAATAGSTSTTPVTKATGAEVAAGIRPDTLSISSDARAMEGTERVAAMLLILLLAEKKKEHDLVVALIISELALRRLVDLCPAITVSVEDGERVYSITGSVDAVSQAVNAGNIGDVFKGGIVAMATAVTGMAAMGGA
jgi:hypothetical protein